MKLKLTLLALLAGSSMVTTAQTAGAPKTREEVKAEAKDVTKKGETSKPEVAPATERKSASGKPREDVKAEARAATKKDEVRKPEVAEPSAKK